MNMMTKLKQRIALKRETRKDYDKIASNLLVKYEKTEIKSRYHEKEIT